MLHLFRQIVPEMQYICSCVNSKENLRRHNLVLGIGVMSILLSLAGLISYAIVQVPSYRAMYGQYQLGDEYLNTLAY